MLTIYRKREPMSDYGHVARIVVDGRVFFAAFGYAELLVYLDDLGNGIWMNDDLFEEMTGVEASEVRAAIMGGG